MAAKGKILLLLACAAFAAGPSHARLTTPYTQPVPASENRAPENFSQAPELRLDLPLQLPEPHRVEFALDLKLAPEPLIDPDGRLKTGFNAGGQFASRRWEGIQQGHIGGWYYDASGQQVVDWGNGQAFTTGFTSGANAAQTTGWLVGAGTAGVLGGIHTVVTGAGQALQSGINWLADTTGQDPGIVELEVGVVSLGAAPLSRALRMQTARWNASIASSFEMRMGGAATNPGKAGALFPPASLVQESGGGRSISLFRTGNAQGPTRLRPSDIVPDANGMVRPGQGGLSTFNSQENVLTKGRLYELPPEAPLPPQVRAVPDASAPGHVSLEPAYEMPYEEFQKAVDGIIWQTTGVKLK